MAHQDDIIIGLMFGDEGKGTTVDFLSTQRTPKSVIRFSGGAQAAHNVILPDGTHHTFAQFGSASLRSIPTTLTRYMIINPLSLIEEGDLICRKTNWNPFPTLNISEKSLITTPIHIWINRKKEESRGTNAHGSCGIGVGETRYYSLQHPNDAPTMKDIEYSTASEITQKLEKLREYAERETATRYTGMPIKQIVDSYINIRDADFLNILPDRKITRIISDGYHIFEGSQGVLLDEWQGFHPHTTWSETTSKNAQKLLQEAGKPAGKVTGVTRTYLTRHGHGPFPSEIPTHKSIDLFPETHNTYGTYQGGWRAGWFDKQLFTYAVKANGGVDTISLTHTDKAVNGTKIVNDYGALWPDFPTSFYGTDMEAKHKITKKMMQLAPNTVDRIDNLQQLMHIIEQSAEAKIELTSYGPRSDQKKAKR